MGEAEFESLDAADTTVLVTGATGRVGRVLVRKLLLRGYKVKALVRQREGGAAAEAPAAPAPAAAADGSTSVDGSDGQEALPQAAELVYGDVADYKACRQAVKGVDKVRRGESGIGVMLGDLGIGGIWVTVRAVVQSTEVHDCFDAESAPCRVLAAGSMHAVPCRAQHHSTAPPPPSLSPLQVICCSGARTTITADLARVDDLGVSNLAKAFMDELVRPGYRPAGIAVESHCCCFWAEVQRGTFGSLCLVVTLMWMQCMLAAPADCPTPPLLPAEHAGAAAGPAVIGCQARAG